MQLISHQQAAELAAWYTLGEPVPYRGSFKLNRDLVKDEHTGLSLRFIRQWRPELDLKLPLYQIPVPDMRGLYKPLPPVPDDDDGA